MNSLSHLTAQLAMQVDRKLLHSQGEADYYRMDIPAHESIQPLAMAQVRRFPLHEAKRFVLAALVIYLALFSITNAAAYSKIAMADLTEYLAQEDPVMVAPIMEVNPWTGELMIEHIPKERQLEALETATAQPENGIIPFDFSPSPYDDRVRIPSIGVDAPIVTPEIGVEALTSEDWNGLEDSIRDSLQQGVVHYPGTAEAGRKGNFFLTGHSSNVFWEPSEYNTVFALLPRLEPGDDIFVTVDQQEYHYVVTEKYEVNPKDVSVLDQGDGKKMTLMTCTPVGTTLKRLVVTAELQN